MRPGRPQSKLFENSCGRALNVNNNASVTVRSTGQRVKSVVKADESGTIVLVCNPKPHLTAHDKDGKLVFDGEIDTPEQRAKVPPELWEKVEPLLDKVGAAGRGGAGDRPCSLQWDLLLQPPPGGVGDGKPMAAGDGSGRWFLRSASAEANRCKKPSQ